MLSLDDLVRGIRLRRAGGGVASSLDGDGSPSAGSTEAGSSTRPGSSTYSTSSAITEVTATASSSLGINGPS